MFTDNHNTLMPKHIYDIDILNVELKTTFFGIICECDMNCILYDIDKEPIKSFVFYVYENEYFYIKVYYDNAFNKLDKLKDYKITNNDFSFNFSYNALLDPDDLVDYGIYDRMKNESLKFDLDIYENYSLIDINIR